MLGIVLRGVSVASAPPPAAVETQAFPSIGPPGYLLPEDFILAVDQSIRFSWRHAEVIDPWPSGSMTHAFVRALGEQANFDSIPSADGRIAEVAAAAAGVTMAGVTLTSELAKPDAGDLARLEEPTVRIEAGSAVRLVRCSKTLVRRDDDATRGQRSAIAISKAGPPTEIRPMMDPTVALIGSDVPLRVFAGSAARPGAVLHARLIAPAAGAALPEAVEQTIRANESAIAILNVSHAGVWLIEYETVMESHPLADPADPKSRKAEVTWYQATLTFEVPTP